jgi:F-type H+-transporting ATPase subunit b
MDETLKQLGELLLRSIPTVLFLMIVWGLYRLLVHKKLEQILGQRHALTEGAVQEAQREIASAEARTSEYEQRLREARSAVYKAQEARRQQMVARQSAALAEARGQADEMIKQARAVLEKDVAAARTLLQQQADSLANEIIASILKPAAVGGGR